MQQISLAVKSIGAAFVGIDIKSNSQRNYSSLSGVRIFRPDPAHSCAFSGSGVELGSVSEIKTHTFNHVCCYTFPTRGVVCQLLIVPTK
jgi:hypothetical protein